MKVRPFAVTRKTRPAGRPFTCTRLTISNSSTSFHITLLFSTLQKTNMEGLEKEAKVVIA
jgi:hypothetical protein